MGFIEDAQKQIEEMTPDKGFNLCGLDDSGDPTEQGLYLINNFSSEEEANAELAKRRTANPDVRYYIYPALGASSEASPAKAFMRGQEE